MTRRFHSRLVASVTTMALAAALVASSLPSLAADVDALDRQAERDVRAISKLLRQLKVKGEPTVIVDGTGDLIDASTGRAAVGPGDGDARVLAYLVTDAGKAQVKAVKMRMTSKKTDAIAGNQAEVAPGRWLVAVVVTDGRDKGKIPDGTQGLLGLGGPEAMPLFVNSTLDGLAGNQSVVLFGKFPEYPQLLAGTTSLIGVEPGERPPWNEANATTFGFREGNTWVLITPIGREASSFDLQLQSRAGGSQLLDPVTTSRGVDRFPIDGSPLADDFCYSGRVYATKDADGELTGHQIEFAVETDATVDASVFDAFRLTTVGDDPQVVPGGFQTFPGPGGGTVAIGNFVADPNSDVAIAFETWQTPEAAPSLSSTNMRGGAEFQMGVESGMLFSGPCGQLPQVPDGLGPGQVDALVGTLGYDSAGFEHLEFPGQDGSDNRILLDPAVGEPAIIVGTDGRPSTVQDFERRIATSYCEVSDFDRGLAGALERCPDGTQRLFWLEPLVTDGVAQDYGRTWFIEIHPGGFADGDFPDSVILPLEGSTPAELDEALDVLVGPYQGSGWG